jgi:hypothetical protein
MNLKSTAAGRGSFDLSLVIYCSLGTLEPNSAYTRMQECKNARMQECKSARKGFTKLVICLLTPLRATAIHSRPVRKGNKKSQIELIER